MYIPRSSPPPPKPHAAPHFPQFPESLPESVWEALWVGGARKHEPMGRARGRGRGGEGARARTSTVSSEGDRTGKISARPVGAAGRVAVMRGAEGRAVPRGVPNSLRTSPSSCSSTHIFWKGVKERIPSRPAAARRPRIGRKTTVATAAAQAEGGSGWSCLHRRRKQRR